MKSKIDKISSIISLGLIIIMLVSIAVSSLPTTANAYTEGIGYTGQEDPENIDDFHGSMAAMNKYKAWCIFKGLGMDDNQAVAALACMQAESTSLFRSDIIEGPDALDLCELEDSLENYEIYTDIYSSQMDTNADFRTKVTDAIMRKYGISDETIELCHDGDFSGNRDSDVLGTTISLETYYDAAGVGWVGCGLYQFTGDSLKRLFAWSELTGQRWFEYENQMAYYIAKTSDGGYKGEVLQDWIEATKGLSLDECVETYFHAMINGNSLPDFVAARQAIANELFPQFIDVEWNKKYAKKVLAMAGVKMIEVRSGIQDRGIVYSYASTVVYYPRNDGFILNRTQNGLLRERNEKVWTEYISNLQGGSASSPTYSLFELYGENINWFRYFGEATYTPTIIDHVWSAIDQNKVKDLVRIDTIDYDAYNFLSCNVYPDRPLVLAKTDIQNGDKDPRVNALLPSYFNGFDYVVGSLKLTISKWLVALVAFLIGPELRQTTLSIINYIESTTIWSAIKPPILAILSLAVIFFIWSLVGKAIKFAKGQGSAREAISRFLISVLCIGLVYIGVARPSALNTAIDGVVNCVDNIFNATLTATLSTDEVINVSDPSLTVHAALWRKAIFNPWCRGQFDNREYEDLYTHFSGKPVENMLPQDNEAIDPTDQTGRPYYDSATATGDVFVPTGGGNEIRNWAAYAYSCGTIYHIDSTLDETAAESLDTSLGIRFPHWTTKTTANNQDIAADLFRVLDAQMNISPQYFANGNINQNYVNAYSLKNHFSYQGNVALFNTLLLLVMIPVIYKKLMSFILLMITVIKMVYYSISEIFKEGNGLSQFFSSIRTHFIDYCVASLKINLIITTYYIFVDSGFFKLVLYLLCCIVILSFSWKDMRYFFSDAAATLKRLKRRF